MIMTYLELFNLASKQFLTKEITTKEFIEIVKLIAKKIKKDNK